MRESFLLNPPHLTFKILRLYFIVIIIGLSEWMVKAERRKNKKVKCCARELSGGGNRDLSSVLLQHSVAGAKTEKKIKTNDDVVMGENFEDYIQFHSTPKEREKKLLLWLWVRISLILFAHTKSSCVGFSLTKCETNI